MNLKTLCALIATTFVFCSALFGETVNLTGTVVSVTDTKIVLLSSSKEEWTIDRTADTTVSSGKLEVGSTVTVQTVSTSAHKNEKVNNR